jgi:hypothetical protein
MVTAFPMKWYFAKLQRVSIYIVNEMGTPCILRMRKGANRNIKGIMRASRGDVIFTNDMV